MKPKIILIQDFFQKPELARFSIGFRLTAPFNNMWTLKFKAQPIHAFFATVNRTVLASDYSRARGDQIVLHSSDSETVLGSSRKLGGTAEHLVGGSEKRICRSTFEF